MSPPARRLATSLLARASRTLVGAQAGPAASTTRAFAAAPPTPPPAAGGDPVLDAFKEHQAEIRAMVAGLKNVAVPLTGDAAAAKKFAADVGALRSKIGAPDPADLEAATVEHALKAAGGDVRRFLAGLASGGGEGAVDEALVADLTAALEAAEKEGGASLAGGGDGGPGAARAWAAFAAKAGALAKAKGLDDLARVREAAAVASATDALAALRGAAADAVEAAARRDGLAAGEVDLGSLKPKW